MTQLFHFFVERLKALFLTDVALDLEAEFLTRDAERKAHLLQRAAKYEEEGLPEVAEELRSQALTIQSEQPLARVVPTIAHLQTELPPTLSALELSEPAEEQPPESGESNKAKADQKEQPSDEHEAKDQPDSETGSRPTRRRKKKTRS